MTSHDGAHAETPRAPAHEEESGTISCPKRFAPRAMWPMPTHAQKDSHLAHISLKKDSCPKRFAPRAMGPVQKRLGAHAETPGKSTIYNWPAPPSTIKEAPKLLSQRQEDGEGKQVFRKCR